MAAADQQRFIDGLNNLSSFFPDYGPALEALNALAMPDMLQALQAITPQQRQQVLNHSRSSQAIGDLGLRRILFADSVVSGYRITDRGINTDQVNDGREFLGCTRLDDPGVQFEIDRLLNNARAGIATGDPDYTGFLAGLDGAAVDCCGAVRAAWLHAANFERTRPRASLIANLAAAAHYLLARAEVCAAHASSRQMKIIIEGYDLRKIQKIETGDVHLDSMAQVKGNPPFPPDFAIRAWAYKGADQGEADRSRCNGTSATPWFVPKVGDKEWGIN